MIDINSSKDAKGYSEGWSLFHENGFLLYKRNSDTQLEIRSILKDGGFLQINNSKTDIDNCISSMKTIYANQESWHPGGSYNDVEWDIDYMLCRRKSHEAEWISADTLDGLLNLLAMYKKYISIWFYILGEINIEIIERDFDRFLKNIDKNAYVMCMATKVMDDRKKYNAIVVETKTFQ